MKRITLMDFWRDECPITKPCFECEHKSAVSGDWIYCNKKEAWVREID